MHVQDNSPKQFGRLMETVTDDPFTVGGTDFMDSHALTDSKRRLADLRSSGADLYFSFGPSLLDV